MVAVTDKDGNITDTLKYDAYGSVTERTGTSALIFGYNGQYGVLTDPNGLLYMRTRFYNPDLKRFMNADILDGSIEDSTSLNLYTFVNGNPISFVDPFGMSAERGQNNENVINGLHWLYNCSYDYYDFVNDESERMRITNDAVMTYLIYLRFYCDGNNSELNYIAWQMVAGNPDLEYLMYMSTNENNDFSYLRSSEFYDLDTGGEIDFLHMIATIKANYYCQTGLGFIDESLNSYAGWAGDLVTLAGEVQQQININNSHNIPRIVNDLMKSQNSTFSPNDLIGDIDAIFISEYMNNMPISEAFRTYYTSDYKNRYTLFFNKEFSGNIDIARTTAESFLHPSPLNWAFKYVFHSSYDQVNVPDIAQGFAGYIADKAGR